MENNEKQSVKAKENKKNHIIKAAVQVFSREGYYNTRMEEIAKVAGIGKGTIYEYFNSKLQLFQEMMDKTGEMYYKTLSTDNINDLHFAEKMALIMEAHFRFCQDNKQLTRLLFWDVETFDKELKEWAYNFRTEKEAQMQQLVEEGINKGHIKKVDAKLLTLMIVGIMGSIWMPLVLDNWQIDVREVAQKASQIIMQGIAMENQ